MAKRKTHPFKVIAKTLSNGRDETLWWDDPLETRDRGGVISHHKGNDFLTVTVIDTEERPTNRFSFITRSAVRQMLPYLQRFADGGDFGTRKPRAKTESPS